MRLSPKLVSIIGFLLFWQIGQAQTVTLSGYVKDEATGESLPFANIINKANPTLGTSSNAYGFYSLSLPKGDYDITYSYLGYNDLVQTFSLQENKSFDAELRQGIQLEELLVTAKDEKENVESTEMGTIELPVEKIKAIPALMGEVDVLKTLQLLPGVMSAGEGTSGFYVRGGGPDQNLILLDEAVVYNSGHLLGFFSVFNADAIKNTTLIKGSMPAAYGGRLSSVVDIQMKEGNMKNYSLEGGIGLISTRLTAQGPIVRDKSSFIVSGRRTYGFDLAQPALKGGNLEGTNYYFYDLNTKVNYRFSDKDRLYLSGYFGRDVFVFKQKTRDLFFRLPYGNSTATLRWNHLFNDKLFMNVSAIYNDYDFSLEGGQTDFSVKVFSGVRDYNGKIDFDYYPNPKHNIRFGANYTYHKLTPNIANATSGDDVFSSDLESKFANETAFYLQDDIKVNPWLSTNVGLRFSMFTQLGPYTSPLSGERFEKGDPVTTYTGLEPRASAKVSLSETSSIKAGISYNYQYLHLVSNSASTLPTDIWVPSTELVKPQKGLQYGLGYFKNLFDNKFETSVELYYKDLQNQIDYGESFVDDPAVDVENEFVFGDGWSYGAEFFARKNLGALTGWIGYTLSKTERQFPDIKRGEVYPAKFDRRHDLSVVANYELNDKWQFGGVFVFGTGNTYTPLRSFYLIEQNFQTRYGDRNSARIDDYHRLDLSATWTPKGRSFKGYASSWTFSMYNTYNRLNPFFIYYTAETEDNLAGASGTAVKVAIFPVIPSITWNFKFSTDRKNEK
ncbi:MAG: TonB-dependent receptor [Saprospiraceae bacterium]|nr:TonB-dependent receptor [Saprospiraceae bacterium]